MGSDGRSDEGALEKTAVRAAPWQETFLHYRILAKLGEGGMGAVFKAEDQRLGRVVALKRLANDGASDADARARLVREARAASALNHPNIVTIYSIEETPHEAVLVMEHVEGETLEAALTRAPLPSERAISVGAELADALACAHAAGIIHRDIKPSNVMLTVRGAKLLDFGIAKATSPTAPVSAQTAAGMLVGTAPYMSPEQLRALPLDGRSDLFALGALLYEAVTGRLAFPARDLATLVRQITAEEPTTPRLLVPSVPEALERVILRALAKEPARRFEGAAEMATALRDARTAKTATGLPSAVEKKKAGVTSVAVLPFLDLSAARDQAHLCDGIAEELITALAKVDGLRVAARSSSFALRGSELDARTVGQRLGVDSVLEGAVRRSGDRLRVTVQLIDVADAYPRWSHRFDGTVADVFGVEDEIAAGVVGALRGIVSARDQEVLRRPETSADAYEHFLRGRHLLNSLTIKSLDQCEKELQRAIELDGGYAPAYALLVVLHVWRGEWFGSADAAAAAEGPSQKAIELGPHLAETHVARAQLHALRREYQDAAREFEAAIAIDPSSFEAHYFYARAAFAMGDDERAARLFLRAGEVRLEDFQSTILAAMPLERLGRTTEGRAARLEGQRRAERALELDPDNVRALSLGAPNLMMLGDRARAIAWGERARALAPHDIGVMPNIACMYARAGLKAEALDVLEQHFGRGYGKRDWIEHDPDYDSLRDDPRFIALLAQLR